MRASAAWRARPGGGAAARAKGPARGILDCRRGRGSWTQPQGPGTQGLLVGIKVPQLVWVTEWIWEKQGGSGQDLGLEVLLSSAPRP